MPFLQAHPRHTAAGKVFVVLATLFVLLFGAVELWLAADQYALLSALANIKSQSLPKSLEQQRLVRNLSALQIEGERLLGNAGPERRVQSQFVVDLIANHPSITENAEARGLTEKVSRFLREASQNTVQTRDTEVQWAALSHALAQLADQISVTGVGTLSADVDEMAAVVQATKIKLALALLAAALCMGGLLLAIWTVLIKPLQQIDLALKQIKNARAGVPLPGLPVSPIAEIQSVHDATAQLHHMVSENERIRAGLEVSASTDSLTGLKNRHHFMTEANSALALAKRHHRTVVVGMADLDHFKRINDEFGHAAGDAVLQSVAQQMRECLRESDIYCRYGGEEFAFVFPDTTLPEARVLADRWRSQLAERDLRLPDGRAIHITVSMGLVSAHTFDLEVALRHADEALYVAKHSGRDQVTCKD